MKTAHLLLALGLPLLGQSIPTGSQPMPKPAVATADDPYLWLEEVTGEKPLAWVKERNAESAKELEQGPAYKALEAGILKILDSEAKIPYISKAGAYFYNFWRDAKHPRGLWRRTSLAEYRKAKPAWEVVLDIDALGAAEKESWVFHGAQFLRPNHQRCLLTLSRGGSDAAVIREFDVVSKTFVKDGFQLSQAKSHVSWIDQDTLFIGTDFGPGSLTTSGYPRIAKLWKRGTPLSQAKFVFEGKDTDVSAEAYHDATPGFERNFAHRSPTFFTDETYLIGKDGATHKIAVPDDAERSVTREWLLVKPRTPWTVGVRTYSPGSLIATRFDDFMAGKREFTVLFEPTATTSLETYTWTRRHLVINLLDDVKNKLFVFTPGKADWKRVPLKGAPAIGTASVWAVDPDKTDEFFMQTADFLTPDSLFYGTLGKAPEKLKASPAFFDASKLEVTQHFVASKDGTRIPYFQVSRKGLKLDGTHPTLLSGYGGFEVSELPYYNTTRGLGWLNEGGVFVLANIRGGGEYGPQWHQAALKQHRLRAYEDFAAVAQDLISRKVTSAKHLGCQGGSNGGLLVGNMITLYPQLFGAVVCQIPLLDMKRYTHLLAGASWMGEYGDPDKPEEWEYIKTFSPYQNVKAGVAYPPTLFMTTTRDDRVHPGHARKMMAKMKDLGCDVRYFENIEGGHGAGADNRQAAHFTALAYAFLWKTLK
ncbi:MAG TPA: prolyl oligopeptidase family serine peptidase [Geothrix sp.]|nr:prolyl oligopeptidase family serine peptidase [Geothrix sp.]